MMKQMPLILIAVSVDVTKALISEAIYAWSAVIRENESDSLWRIS